MANISPYLAGVLLLVTNVVDAVAEPVVGRISDRTRPRKYLGRRRFWLAIAVLPTATLYLLSWVVIPGSDELGLFLWFLVTHTCWAVAHTIPVVNCDTLSCEMTTDYNERSTLMGTRWSVIILGALAGVTYHSLLVENVLAYDVQFGVCVCGVADAS